MNELSHVKMPLFQTFRRGLFETGHAFHQSIGHERNTSPYLQPCGDILETNLHDTAQMCRVNQRFFPFVSAMKSHLQNGRL